jgi:Protein of unknown function (DUF2950)
MACAMWPGTVRGASPSAFSQRTFASPADATNALIQAAKAQDRGAIRELFGPEVTNLWTGDATLDEKHFKTFAKNVTEQCKAVPQGNDKVTLELGQASWSFPIPLIKTNGVWLFDTPAGEEEIINRHIGRDEYYAIAVCRAYVKAQREYALRFATGHGTPKYAKRLRSRPGKMDGLYWPAGAGGAPSPISEFIADACLEKYNWSKGKGPRSFHGYLFKILTRQGPDAPGGKMNYIAWGDMTRGFGLVAYPVRWAQSGVMTFIVNQDGVVYQRSLGEKTTEIATAMKEFNPGPGWTAVREPGIVNLTLNAPGTNPPLN